MTQTGISSLQKKQSTYRGLYQIRSIVPAVKNALIESKFVYRIRPVFIQKPENFSLTLAGFPLLQHENQIDKYYLQQNKNNAFINYVPHPNNNQTLPIPRSLAVSYEENSLKINASMVYSITIHSLIILFLVILFLKFPQKNPYGNASEGQEPVDVVFVPQATGQSGLTGEGDNGQESDMQPSPQAVAAPAMPPAINSAPSEEVPPPESVEALPEVNATAPITVTKQSPKKQSKPTLKNHTYTYRHTTQRPRRERRVTQQQNASPFSNMTQLDFSENPNKSKRKSATRSIPQGSRSAVNLSTGPLVKNGKINVPYAAKISIKGVSDAYAQAVNVWIQRHMYYPADAARQGQDGSPTVRLILDRDGQVISVTLTKASGSDALDDAIVGMFRNSQLPKIPPDLPDHFVLDLTINYILIRQ